MILIRTQDAHTQLLDFAGNLTRWSGMPVCLIMDERHGKVAVPEGVLKISLTQESCEELAIHCPEDFAWRCGDYGLYLARRQFPEVSHFWMIESDVRIVGEEPEQFFEIYRNSDIEFLASYMKPATCDWYWYRATANRDIDVYKCFFPVCRFSAGAIDRLLAIRQTQSASWARRHFWPNDEAFVATTMIGGGFSHADLNDVGQKVYDVSEFNFETLFDGDSDLPSGGPLRLFHPVLFGKALEAKRKRLAQRQEPLDPAARLIDRFDRKLGLSAIADRVNQGSPWAG